jgi:hypothetical protein
MVRSANDRQQEIFGMAGKHTRMTPGGAMNVCGLWPAARSLSTVVLFAVSVVSADAQTVKPVISEHRGLADFDLDGNGGWKVTDAAIVLEKAGVPATAGVPGGPYRGPGAIAILKMPPMATLTFSLDVKSTAPVDLDVRDVVLIFGYRSPEEFYYVHIARKTDQNHNGIFIVNHADRRRLDAPGSRAPLVDQNWHRLRLERDAASGSIRVFFDRDAEPFLSFVDRTILTGRVGFGSFDETGEFRAFEVRGAR